MGIRSGSCPNPGQNTQVSAFYAEICVFSKYGLKCTSNEARSEPKIEKNKRRQNKQQKKQISLYLFFDLKERSTIAHISNAIGNCTKKNYGRREKEKLGQTTPCPASNPRAND